MVSIGTGGAKKTNKPKPVTGAKPKSTLSAAHIRQDLQKNICNDDLVCDTLVHLRYQAALKEQAGGLRPTLLAARDRDRDQFALDFDALAKLTLPVLLVHGMNDKVVPLSRSLELLNVMPTADAHFYSQAGHWPHIGKADEFNDLVSSYIKHNS